ncbi:NAD(P)H nitroreductase [PVC group bacterium (ex Bugula neritina AB1)]|nr:NAD(P)H nitroreductase [PVC group bacterium (ex Bugula neritina AB1)]
MEKPITHYAKTRYTSKAYDPSKKISDKDFQEIKDLLRYSPSSTNSQPWHFIIAKTAEGKQRIAKANEKTYPFNNPSILSASHVIIFCSRLKIEDIYLKKLLQQEESDGRFLNNDKFKSKMDKTRRGFLGLYSNDERFLQSWMARQVYLNLGQFLLGVSTMGIDATAMEGIDTKTIDEEFNLHELGYMSLVAVTLGYRDDAKDFNANLPKSRLPLKDIITEF